MKTSQHHHDTVNKRMREKIAKLENELVEAIEECSKFKSKCYQLKLKIGRIQDENHSSRMLHMSGMHTSRNMSVSSAYKPLESSILLEVKPRNSIVPPLALNSNQMNKSGDNTCLLMTKKDTSCKR